MKKKNTGNRQNLEAVTSSKEFSGFSKFLLSKIKSPYKNVTYSIKKNDTIEKILKKFDVREEDIKNISVKLKQKKLSNIYSGRKLDLVLKDLGNNSNTVKVE